ncbi:hypothetical protein BT96DRAFT_1008276 [Gymnopus androsaceus JB14]|uniref:Uncharacterized protein n=1 Tax=Gymnopus androsaceus JB14 TaxID=1447944 RepID=A0A6A4GFP7_9AGAR|nr:hypothetical protein BT96DRAFT_1008276 [Gymnopus androsaceus JB14]
MNSFFIPLKPARLSTPSPEPEPEPDLIMSEPIPIPAASTSHSAMNPDDIAIAQVTTSISETFACNPDVIFNGYASDIELDDSDTSESDSEDNKAVPSKPKAKRRKLDVLARETKRLVKIAKHDILALALRDIAKFIESK